MPKKVRPVGQCGDSPLKFVVVPVRRNQNGYIPYLQATGNSVTAFFDEQLGKDAS